jgi:hypothetical protein
MLIIFSFNININLKSLKLDIYYIFAIMKFPDGKIIISSDIVPHLII